MTIDEMAKEIKTGNETMVLELWEKTQRFIFYYLTRLENHNPRNKARMIQMGITHEDVQQEAFIIYMEAIEKYDTAGTYSFLSLLKYRTMNRFFNLIGMRTASQRNDPFTKAERLEKPLPGLDNEALTVGDSIEDETASIVLSEVLDQSVCESCKAEILAILDTLSPIERHALYGKYFRNKTLKELGMERNVSGEAIRRLQTDAINKIKRRYRRILFDYAAEMDIIDTNAYRSSLSSFRRTWSSSTERTAEKIIEQYTPHHPL